MKLTQLIHNPKAGEEDHYKKELLALIESEGFNCRYSSTKKDDWQQFEPDLDFVIVAGGDGTVGKVAKEILNQSLNNKLPIALLPLGTANNIANALGVNNDAATIIHSWHHCAIKKFDVGSVESLTGTTCFLEGFGYGLFPQLMKEMAKLEIKPATPEEELKIALEVLRRITHEYKPHQCELEIDGVDHSGKFLLVEIMNIRSIGPNLNLAPMADPGDGRFDVVLIPETDREKLAQYIHHKINDLELVFPFKTIPASQIRMQWGGTHLHVDDELIKQKKPTLIQINVQAGRLQFLQAVKGQ